MLISHSHRFIFVHIYKNAGTSVKKILERHSDFSIRSRNPIKRLKYELGIYPKFFNNSLAVHSKAWEIKNAIPDHYDKYFSFAMVRNPWDWQVSLYAFMLQNQNHYQHDLIKSMNGFEQYIEWRCSEELQLQKSFISDEKGNQIVDYIGRVETLQKDMGKILNQLSIPKVNIPHHNKSKRVDYREYYNAKTRKMIHDYFSDDIEYFNYEF